MSITDAPTLARRERRPLLSALGTGSLLLLLAALPYLGLGAFTLTLATEALILAIWAMSLDLLVGYTGLLTFGHAAAFGLGGYVAAYVSIHVSPDLLLTAAAAVSAAVAVAAVAGLLMARLSGVAFAIVSLALCQILFQVAVGWRSVTQGMDGLIGVPLPSLLGHAISDGAGLYYVVAIVFAAAWLTLRRLLRSPFGACLYAIRVNEVRAASIGIDVRLHKWGVYVLSWGLAGLAGMLLVFLKAGITPMTLHWSESGHVLMMAILGGLGTLLGPALGAVLFVFLRDLLSSQLQAVWQLVFGLAFVAVVLFMPHGIAGSVIRIWRRLWPQRS